MSEGVSTLSGPDGVPVEGFNALLVVGRERGSLTPDDLMPLLKTVELTPDLLTAILERFAAEGVTYEADDPDVLEADEELAAELAIADEVDSAIATSVVAAPVRPEPATAPRSVPSRPPRMRSVAKLLADDGSLSGVGPDPVRTYLKEIGKVPLLNGEEEVALARRLDARLEATARVARVTERHGDDAPARDIRRDQRCLP